MSEYFWATVIFLSGVWFRRLQQSQDPCEHFAATIYFPFRVWFRFWEKLKARETQAPDYGDSNTAGSGTENP